MRQALKKTGYAHLFGQRLYATFFLSVFGFSLALFSYVLQFSYSDTLNSQELKAKALVRLIANVSAEHLLGDDFFGIQNILNNLAASEPNLAYAFVLNKDAHALAHTFVAEFPVKLFGVHNNFSSDHNIDIVEFKDDKGAIIVSYSCSVVVAERRIGTAIISFYKKGFFSSLHYANLAPALPFVLGFFCMVLFSFILVKELRERLELSLTSLEQAMARLSPIIKPKRHSLQKKDGSLSILSYYTLFFLLVRDAKNYFDKLLIVNEQNLAKNRILSALTNSLQDLIIIYDSEGKIQSLNPAFCKYFGVNEADKVGEYPDKVLDLKIGVIVRTENNAMFNGAGSISKEMSLDIHGEKHIFHVESMPIFDENKKICNILDIMTDITALKAHQETKVLSSSYHFCLLMSQFMLKKLNQHLAKTKISLQKEIDSRLSAQNNQNENNQAQNSQNELAIVHDSLNVVSQYATTLEATLIKNQAETSSVNLAKAIDQVISAVRGECLAKGLDIELEIREENLMFVGAEFPFQQVCLSLFIFALESLLAEQRFKGILTIKAWSDPIARTVVLTLLTSCDKLLPTVQPELIHSYKLKDSMPSCFDSLLTQEMISYIIEYYKGSFKLVNPVPANAFSNGTVQTLGENLGAGELVRIELPLA